MEQIAEKITNNYESARTRRSLADDGNTDGSSDDEEFATAGFYVREKSNDKKSTSADSPSSSNNTAEPNAEPTTSEDLRESISDKNVTAEEEEHEGNEAEAEKKDADGINDVTSSTNEKEDEDNVSSTVASNEAAAEKKEEESGEEKKEEPASNEDVIEGEDNEKKEEKMQNIEEWDKKEKEEKEASEEKEEAKTKGKEMVNEKKEEAEAQNKDKEEAEAQNRDKEEAEARNRDKEEAEARNKDKEEAEAQNKDKEEAEARNRDKEEAEAQNKNKEDEAKAQNENKEEAKANKEDPKESSFSKQPSSSNGNEDEDFDFDPSLLCPDISMDVDEAPVLTNQEQPPPTDGSTSPLPYEPVFSTLVDEITGAEVQVDLTPKEMELRANMYGPSNPVQTTKIHCTACNVHLGSALTGANNRFVHPLLKVLICKNCYHFYTSGEFEKDEDGSELYCRWCGQGGQVLCCSSCEFVFCKRCIRNNFGPKKFKEIRDSDDWSCFRCEPTQLSYLRASCAEFMDYYRTELRRAQPLAANNPELMTRDYTKCCSVERTKEDGKGAPGSNVQRVRRRKKENEDDPDYDGEPPAKRQAPSSGGAPNLNPTPNSLRSIAPKPLATAPVSGVARPQVPVGVVKVGGNMLRARTPIGQGGIRNSSSTSGYLTLPSTGTASTPGYIKLVPQQARPQGAVVRPSSSYTVVSGTTNGKPTFTSVRPPAPVSSSGSQPPSMRHEWFEKTVRAAARVNSNLSYTLTQLNRQQSQATSVESLAIVHNKLQEVLSTSINSLIQVRKNLRTEFLAGIKTAKFPPKPPIVAAKPAPKPMAVKEDDDVIFISQPPPLILSPSITLTTKKAAPLKGKAPAQKPPAPIGGPVKGGGFLKVRSLTALQSVPSECITIPDDPIEDPLKIDKDGDRIEILDDEPDKDDVQLIGADLPPPLVKLCAPASNPITMTYNVKEAPSPEVRRMMDAHVPIVRCLDLEARLKKEAISGMAGARAGDS